jgi:hypothetical protein
MNADTTKIVNDYYSKNYDKLNDIASRILGKVRRTDLACILVSESYTYVIDNLEKVQGLIEQNKVESVIVNFMHKSVLWKNDKFYKDNISTNTKSITWDDFMHLTEFDDEEEMLEKEFVHQSKIAHIRSRHALLDMPSRVLYDLSIEGPYNSSGKLSNYINVNRTTTAILLRNIKNFLKEDYINPIKEN